MNGTYITYILLIVSLENSLNEKVRTNGVQNSISYNYSFLRQQQMTVELFIYVISIQIKLCRVDESNCLEISHPWHDSQNCR
jgi:hypothetical protein